MKLTHALLTVVVLASPLAAQTFSVDTLDIPQGSPFNAGYTENVEFLDIDGDGDLDVLWADGGDFGNQQNRVWINRGGLQGGATGVLSDETATRWPSTLDDSRDIDFVDLDLDGDLDAFVSNTSGIVNQTNRFMLNMGGAQGGTPGFFQDQTSTRWRNIGSNNGTTTHSSIAPSVALASGGFIDWSCDSSIADVDADGDPDVIEASYGALSTGRVPTRVFLNDGAGYFEEFNPSGFQLSGTDLNNGSPGLWCEGVQQQSTLDATGAQCDIANESISVDIGDFDGDFDLDFVLGDKSTLPRLFANRSAENGGALGFRDVSHAAFPGSDWAPGTGSYEQDLGDLDHDGDLDLFGANWSNVCDTVLLGNGDGTYATPVVVAGSCARTNEPDFVDYDNDGLLDVFTVSRTAEEMLYRNLGAASSWTLDPTTGVLPPLSASGLGCDACDIDQDGDYDLFIATDADEPNVYLRNDGQTPDTSAPRPSWLEQAADRNARPKPTVVRVEVYDNAAWYVTAFDVVQLEYSINGGSYVAAPMRFSGGQVFRGEIPGFSVGAIHYRVRASDSDGNTGLSQTQGFNASPCGGDPLVYCTAKTNSAGCVPMIGTSGVPSASAGSGCFVTAAQVLDHKAGLLFYSKLGPKLAPYQGGYFCVQSPTVRMPLLDSGSAGQAPCTGLFSADFNAWIASGADPALTAGQQVWLQFWSRDPGSSFQTNRTDAVTFFICP
jgi:hypothetical protein